MAPKKQAGKKKKAKNKKPSEKEVLEQHADLFIQQSNLHSMFIDRIGSWLLQNFARIIDIFRQFDKNGDGLLTYDEFFAGMTDLDAPCNKLELMVLAKTVDINIDGYIDYTEFSQGIRYKRPIQVRKDDGLPVLKIVHETFEKCPNCCIKTWKPKEREPSFLAVEIKLESMKSIHSYVGHMNCTVHSHINALGIIDIIKERHSHSFRDIKLFYLEDGCKVPLTDNHSLESIGFHGGTEEEPEQVSLFYEFENEAIDCPILQCDHYFQRKTTLKKR